MSDPDTVHNIMRVRLDQLMQDRAIAWYLAELEQCSETQAAEFIYINAVRDEVRFTPYSAFRAHRAAFQYRARLMGITEAVL